MSSEDQSASRASTQGSFVHPHVHTEYSMLDGAARVGELVKEVARQEMPAIAMTDHGNVFGAFDFYKQATKAGVKPIIGIEAYVAPESRHDKKRVQWGDGGEDFDWYCTSNPEAHVGKQPVYLSNKAELQKLMGEVAYGILAEHCDRRIAGIKEMQAKSLPLFVIQHPATVSAPK